MQLYWLLGMGMYCGVPNLQVKNGFEEYGLVLANAIEGESRDVQEKSLPCTIWKSYLTKTNMCTSFLILCGLSSTL